ncbi:MAG TPA: tetratricopeptide repeat protein, partial [Flavobacteriales bacterium]|nr:tetratricopeptide repeat protein [Flavobacteriales bacterium]
IAISYNNIGWTYKNQGNYEKALEYYYKSLKISEEIGDKEGIADSYDNIGRTYNDLGNYEKAMVYHYKSLKIFEEIGDKRGIATSYTCIGLIYWKQGKYKQALEYHYKSLKIDEERGDKRGIAASIHNLGLIYQEQGNYEKAMEYYSRSLKMTIPENKRLISISLETMGGLYYDQGNLTKALALGSKALQLAQEVKGLARIRDAANILFKTYKAMGNTNKALEMYELYIQMSDSIVNEENTRALVQQEYKYKYEKEQAVADAKHNEEMNLSAEREKRQQLISYGAGGGLLLVLVFAFLIYNRFKKTQKQKKVIQQKNRHITESITYARRIQEASLTSIGYLNKILNEYFILYEPRDIVSGDFYWAYEIDNDKVMIAVCDCTGHGVPGAFMSMISTSLLNEIVIENSITQVDQVLDQMRSRIIKALKQDKDKAEALDGLDMTLLLMDKSKKMLHFAGAGHTLYIARDGNILEEKGNPYPVGYFFGRHKPYSSKEIALQKGDMLYMTSDGFTEQFGGKDDKMFGYAKFKKLISDSKDQPMEAQKEAFYRSFKNWRGSQRQIDDICVMGVRV